MANLSVRSVLDERWKRLLFVLLWVPLASATAAFFLLLMLSISHVYISPDVYWLLECHRKLAMGSFSDPPEIYGADYKTVDGRNEIAWYVIAQAAAVTPWRGAAFRPG